MAGTTTLLALLAALAFASAQYPFMFYNYAQPGHFYAQPGQAQPQQFFAQPAQIQPDGFYAFKSGDSKQKLVPFTGTPVGVHMVPMNIMMIQPTESGDYSQLVQKDVVMEPLMEGRAKSTTTVTHTVTAIHPTVSTVYTTIVG